MTARLHIIDLLRGFCLLNIFVNHVTVGVLHHFSPSNIFLFDSADVFVFLAGISLVLAHGADRHSLSAARTKIWRRSCDLYFVNLAVIAASFTVLCAGTAIAQLPMIENHPLKLLPTHGVGSYLWHVITMQQTVGYSMVLRLYIFLLLLAPLYLWLATKRFWYPLLAAVPLWLISGCFGLVESDALSQTPLRLTVLPWNLTFAAGIAFGAGIRASVNVPRSALLDILSISLAIGLPVVLIVAGNLDPVVLEWFLTRDERFLLGISKTLQSPLRVASLLSTAYLVVRFAETPVIRLLHRAGSENALCILGRNSLPVFALGAVLAQVAEQVIAIAHVRFDIPIGTLPALGLELPLVLASFLAMFWIAGSRKSMDRSISTGTPAM